MGRQKKIKTVQEEIKLEGSMTEEMTLEMTQQEIDVARLELEKLKQSIEEEKQALKSMRNREISKDEERIIDKQIAQRGDREGLKNKIEKQKAYDSQIVRGKFMNRRAPGQPAKLAYIKYDTDAVKWWTLEDGKVYDIPRGFADQLNGGTENDPCYYTPHFIQKQGEMNPEDGSAIHAVDTSNKKYAFVPVSF